MAPRQEPPPRPRARTPAERAEEFASVQHRLKQEAAGRRQDAARKGNVPRQARSSSRRTP